MVYDPTEADTFRRRLLESPGERQGVEYKSSAPFDGESDFSLKLLKHIQGMTNGGGGYIVIGFTETGIKPYEPDPKHTNETAKTYDPTAIAKAVNSSVARGQSIVLSVHPTEFKGLFYPIIAVQPFERHPVVCRSDKDGILRKGAVYVRRPGAETSEVSTPQDWEALINRCVERRRDEFADQFRGMLDALNGRPAQQDVVEKHDDWIEKMRERAFGIE